MKAHEELLLELKKNPTPRSTRASSTCRSPSSPGRLLVADAKAMVEAAPPTPSPGWRPRSRRQA
jgi:hypothetical protein